MIFGNFLILSYSISSSTSVVALGKQEAVMGFLDFLTRKSSSNFDSLRGQAYHSTVAADLPLRGTLVVRLMATEKVC